MRKRSLVNGYDDRTLGRQVSLTEVIATYAIEIFLREFIYELPRSHRVTGQARIERNDTSTVSS